MTVTVQRLIDWPERLAAYFAQHRSTPFAWGGHDCVGFAAGAAQALTGANLLAQTGLRWACRPSAAAALRTAGGLVKAVSSVLPSLPSPAWAQRGDIVLVQAILAQPRRNVRRQWLAVVDGAQWRMPAAAGLAAGDMQLAVHAWGVGHG